MFDGVSEQKEVTARGRDRNVLQGTNLEKANFRTKHQQEIDVCNI